MAAGGEDLQVWGVSDSMKIAFILFNGVTLLDFAGVYDPVTRMKTMGFRSDIEYILCAPEYPVKTFEGVVIYPDQTFQDLSPNDYIVIPGGNGISELMKDPGFSTWLQTISDTTVIAAVCGGSLLAGASGFLKDKKATTHPELLPILSRFCQATVTDRIVDDGSVITAGGVTSSIDLGLYLCEKIAGTEVRAKIQKQMDYHHFPISSSYPSGS